MNGYNIVGGGNIEALIYNINIRTLQDILVNLASSGQLDFSSFTAPATYDIDLGTF